MFSLTTIYSLLFATSCFLLYVLKLLTDTLYNIIDNKHFELSNEINKLKKENNKLNNDMRFLNKTSRISNIKSPIPVMYGCFH